MNGGTSRSGTASTQPGRCRKRGLKRLCGSASVATKPASWCSFIASSRSALLLAGTHKVFTVSARAWESITALVTQVVGGTKYLKCVPFRGEFKDMPVVFSKRPSPNPSIERTFVGKPPTAAHVER